ncbi:MAG: LysR family transcriptional regulator [Nitrospirales bacterium]|nr:LysR family transcriptional regulator [Nitrospirales bacterium]
MLKYRMKREKSPGLPKVHAKEYQFMGRVWVEGKESTFLGFGRIVLLERIKQHGSITEAAKSMGMSYRHAWELVDSMNRQARTPLVETATGGKGGGGTRLTEAGEKAIEFFWGFHKRFKKFLEQEMEHFPL